MKELHLLCFSLLLSLLLFAGCNSSVENTYAWKDQLILKPFSDSLSADSFKLAVKGKKLKELTLQFTIISHKGKEIYAKEFKASDLIANYQSTLELDKEKQQLDFIKQEFDMFFEEENFLEPAVTENEEADQNTPDKEFHAELKKTPLNGFKYRYSNQTKVYIAWSQKEQRVKIYYQCC